MHPEVVHLRPPAGGRVGVDRGIAQHLVQLADVPDVVGETWGLWSTILSDAIASGVAADGTWIPANPNSPRRTGDEVAERPKAGHRRPRGALE